MSMGPLSGAAAANSNYAQRTGNDVDRASHEADGAKRSSDSAERAERAAGIGKTDEDQGVGERDADGRRLWEHPPESEAADETKSASEPSTPPHDPHGDRGTQIDFTA